jgi:hypothetical protein
MGYRFSDPSRANSFEALYFYWHTNAQCKYGPNAQKAQELMDAA